MVKTTKERSVSTVRGHFSSFIPWISKMHAVHGSKGLSTLYWPPNEDVFLQNSSIDEAKVSSIRYNKHDVGGFVCRALGDTSEPSPTGSCCTYIHEQQTQVPCLYKLFLQIQYSTPMFWCQGQRCDSGFICFITYCSTCGVQFNVV